MLRTIFIFNKLKRYQRSDIKDSGYEISKASVSVRCQLKVSATCCVGQSHLATSLNIATTSQIGRFFYVPVRHRKNVSNRSVLLTYQLRCRDDVSALSRTLNLVAKMGQFLLGAKAVHFLEPPVVQPH